MARPRTKNTHLPKYVTVINGSYWYRPPAPSKDAPKPKPTRIGPQGQENLVWKFMLDKQEPVGPITTLSDCFDRYLQEVLPSLAPRTQKDYRRHIAKLRATFGHMRPDELIPRDIGRFLDRLKGKIQANRQVAVLSAIYSKMVGRWYCAEKNPCLHVERNPSKKRTRYVTDAEYEAVYRLASPRVQIMMELALRTYQRQGDLLTLKWEQVTPEGVLFRQSKTGKRLRVKRAPKLDLALERARKLLPHLPREYVVRTRKGGPYTSEGFRACWQRLMKRAMRSGALPERFTFHDLRAKAVSDTKEIQKAFEGAGHTNMAMTRGVYDRGIRDVDGHE